MMPSIILQAREFTKRTKWAFCHGFINEGTILIVRLPETRGKDCVRISDLTIMRRLLFDSNIWTTIQNDSRSCLLTSGWKRLSPPRQPLWLDTFEDVRGSWKSAIEINPSVNVVVLTVLRYNATVIAGRKGIARKNEKWKTEESLGAAYPIYLQITTLLKLNYFKNVQLFVLPID